MNGELVAVCDVCRRPVEAGRGFLRVTFAAMEAYRAQAAEWKRTHGDVSTVGEVLSYPEEARWSPFHTGCDPAKGLSAYQIDAGELETWRGLTRWTALLMAKQWLPETDWGHLLEETVSGEGGRLVAAARFGGGSR